MLNMGLVWRATPPDRFRQIYKRFLSEAAKEFSRVYIFNILPTIDRIEKHSPGLSPSIVRYNKFIAESVGLAEAGNLYLFDVHKFVIESDKKEGTFVSIKDGHHLTLEGHNMFGELVIEHEIKYMKKNE